MTTRPSLRVLLVDDHAVVRAGYRQLLLAHSGFEIVAEASDGVSAHALFCQRSVDVVVMDIALPGVSGIEVLRRMRARRAGAGFLVVSMYSDAVFVRRAFAAGAHGFVSKTRAAEELSAAVRAAHSGQRYLSADVAAALEAPAASAAASALSAREFEVLRLMVQALTAGEIARKLGVSEKTVINYQSVIRGKLAVHNDIALLRRVEALRMFDDLLPAAH